MAEGGRLNRMVVACFGIVGCVFALVSWFSYSIYDWPNPDVFSYDSQTNLCGPVGAFLAYQGHYYLGPGAVVLLVFLVAWLGFYGLGRQVEQISLRVIGVLLLVAAVSTTMFLFSPGSAVGLSHGNGGVLGISAGYFLKSSTAMTGAILIVLATYVVGMLLAADNLVLLVPRLVWHLCERIRLAGPVLVGVGSRAGRAGQALKEQVRIGKAVAEDSIEKLIPRKEQAPEETESEQYDEDVPEGEAGNEQEPVVRDALEEKLHPNRGPVCPAGGGRENYDDYKLPPMDLLEEPQRGFTRLQEKIVKERAKVLEQTLEEFNIKAEVVEAETGPVITMFELRLSPGIKVSQIFNLSNDLARSLGAAAVRVVAPIPGKHTIGIEVPNSEKETVRIKDLLQLAGEGARKMKIPLFLGKDSSGDALNVDLTELPHCLIAGTTGSGKSVCINTIITSILLTQRPDQVKLILVDPKMVEMAAFREIPHLMCPIVTEMKRAEQILEWLTEKMDERYAILAEARVRNISNYNNLSEEEIYDRFKPATEGEKAKIPLRLPYIVIIIDELADLMMTSAKEVESYIIRLAQKSRAVGIHIVLATQRPQATVVTGLIKSNLPTRISFRVAARMDSRIVLDQNGAEALLGQGDMLFLKPGTSDLVRCQGAYVSDKEIHRIVKYLKEVAQPNYHAELVQMNQLEGGSGERDELFDQAVRLILESKRGSVSLLQRRLTIGYSRASRLIDQMAVAGIVGEYKGSQAREVMLTLAEYDQLCRQMARDKADGYRDMQDDEEEDEVAVDPIDEAEAEEVEDSEDEADEEDEGDEEDDDGEEEEEDEDEEEDYEYVDDDESEEEEK